EGGKKVLEWLDNFDFYIHPSLTEGLPRSLIEAMSRGLPIVATNVGGIPELLEENVLVEPRDYKNMSEILINLINNENYYNNQVIKNFEKSQDYNSDYLKLKRDIFWSKIKEKL